MASRFVSSAREMARLPHYPGLLGSTLALGIAFSFFSPFISTWGTQEVGMTPGFFSVFMTCTSISGIIVGTILGRLSDTKVSRRNIMLLSAVGGMLGYVGYAYLRNPYLLGLVGCTVMALSSGCFVQMFAHVREEFGIHPKPGIEPGLVMAILRAFFSFAWTLGPAVGSVILVALGFRGLFSTAAALWLVFLVGVIFFVPNRERPKRSYVNPEDSVWKTFRRPDILVCFLAFLFLFASQSVNMMNLPLAIIHELGGTERDFGIVFGIGPLVEIPMMVWFGHLSSLGYQMRLIWLGFILSLVYFVFLSMATEPWHVYLLQIVSGVLVAITSNVAVVFFQDLLPGQPGLATAIFSNSQAAGSLTGVLSFGFLLEGFGYRGVFISCTVMSVLAILVFAFYRKGPAVSAETAQA